MFPGHRSSSSGTATRLRSGLPNPVLNAGLINSQGGITGANFGIGGINPNLKSPKAAVWSGTVERSFSRNFAASVGYTGSHSYNLVGGGDQAGGVSYGVNINNFAGDLVQNNSLVPTHLNPSFGNINYADNNRYGNYHAVIFDLRGRFSHGFFDASYTRSNLRTTQASIPSRRILSVLRTVSLECSEPLFSSGQLPDSGSERRQGPGWPFDGWLGNYRHDHLSERLSV